MKSAVYVVGVMGVILIGGMATVPAFGEPAKQPSAIVKTIDEQGFSTLKDIPTEALSDKEMSQIQGKYVIGRWGGWMKLAPIKNTYQNWIQGQVCGGSCPRT